MSTDTDKIIAVNEALSKKVKQLIYRVPTDYGGLAEKVIAKYNGHVKTFLGQPYDKMFVFDEKEKYWKEVDKEIIYKDIQDIVMSKHISKQYKESVYDYIKIEKLCIDNSVNPYHIDGQLNSNGLIAVENGAIDTVNMKFVPEFEPNKFTIYKLPIKYVEDADIKPIKDFNISLVGVKQEPMMQQILGSMLIGNQYLKKLFIFIGPPDSGKTGLLAILSLILGIDNCSYFNLEAVTDKWVAVNLSRKLANFGAELSDTLKIGDDGILKVITGADIIEKRIMHSQKTIKIYSIATNIFAVNGLPRLSSNIKQQADDAFYDRFQFIEFVNQFKGENVDPDIAKKMTTDKMKSAWLSYMLYGLQELKKNNWILTGEQDADDVKRIFNKGEVLSDYEVFSTQYYAWNPERFEFLDDIYEDFKRFKDNRKEVYPKKEVFAKKFYKECVWKVVGGRKWINNKQEQIIKGIYRNELEIKQGGQGG